MSKKEKDGQAQNTENQESLEAQGEGRRDALKKILGVGAGLAVVSALPARWSPAVVETLADPPGHGGGRGRGHCDHGRGRGRGHDGDDCGGPTTTTTTTGAPPTTTTTTTIGTTGPF